MAELMQYRSTHIHVPGVSTDIFDGENYQQLRGTPITIHNQPVHPPANYFEDDRDIALGLSTDRYGIFTCGQATAWPLIVFIYNLPPELRVHLVLESYVHGSSSDHSLFVSVCVRTILSYGSSFLFFFRWSLSRTVDVDAVLPLWGTENLTP